MTKINPDRMTTRMVNHEGHPAYKLHPEEEFVTGVLTCLYNEPSFYGNTTARLLNLADQLDDGFVARAAVYARESAHLRTLPVALLARLARRHSKWLRPAMRRVIIRVDQLREFVAAVNKLDPKLIRVHHGARKGMAECLAAFDAYQLAKYNGGRGKIKLADVIKLAHPRPKDDEQSRLWKSVLDGTLAPADTWEVALSAAQDKAGAWNRLIEEDKLGYMAGLRNLRNILLAEAAKLPVLLAKLEDPQQIAKAKQFPFRYYSAYREIRDLQAAAFGMRTVLDSLTVCIRRSVPNLPVFPGATLCSADNSRSMNDRISAKSSILRRDIANLAMALVASRTPEALTSVFGTEFSIVSMPTGADPLASAEMFMHTHVGGSTNGYKVVEYALRNNIKLDRIIIFTDVQLWDDLWSSSATLQQMMAQYWSSVAPECWLHIVDLAGHGTTQVVGQRVNTIAGWSDKIFDYILAVERGAATTTSEIKNMKL